MRYHLSSDLAVTAAYSCDLVIAKVDNVSEGKANQHHEVTSNQPMQKGFGQPISFSAKTGQGKHELWKAIEEKVRCAYSA